MHPTTSLSLTLTLTRTPSPTDCLKINVTSSTSQNQRNRHYALYTRAAKRRKRARFSWDHCVVKLLKEVIGFMRRTCVQNLKYMYMRDTNKPIVIWSHVMWFSRLHDYNALARSATPVIWYYLRVTDRPRVMRQQIVSVFKSHDIFGKIIYYMR